MTQQPSNSGCLRKVAAFLAMPLLGLAAAAIATPFFPKIYLSTATIQAKSSLGSTSETATSPLVAAIQTKEVLQPIIETFHLQEKWNLPDEEKTYVRLRDTLGVRPVREVIQINVLNQDPQLAAQIANAMVDQYQKLPASEPITVWERASAASVPVLPNIYLNLIIGALGGLLAGAILAAIVK